MYGTGKFEHKYYSHLNRPVGVVANRQYQLFGLKGGFGWYEDWSKDMDVIRVDQVSVASNSDVQRNYLLPSSLSSLSTLTLILTCENARPSLCASFAGHIDDQLVVGTWWSSDFRCWNQKH